MKTNSFVLVAALMAVMLFNRTGFAQTNPPVIGVQPQNLFATNGASFYPAFSVTVSGTPPVAFQWQFQGTNLVAINGNYPVMNPSLTLYRVGASNAGPYDVVMTNAFGSVTSSVAMLSIIYLPVVTNQPLSQLITNIANVTFSVGATGTGPFTYQWLLNGKYLTNNIITTVAGTNINGYAGDGGAATNARLNTPTGVAVDPDGDVFIADKYNNRIREVSPAGIITTVAGSGSFGYSDNGGVATNASLSNPSGVAVDEDGDLLIADTENERVRLDIYNTLVTVAGGGVPGSSGDGGPAYNASLNQPAGVAMDGNGNIYIADTLNCRIRKVDVNGLITTVAGNGTATFAGDGGAATNASLNQPNGVTVDAQGNLLIADTFNNRLRKVSTNGIITTVVGSGSTGYFGDGSPATNAGLFYPSGVALDLYGNLFIADRGNNRIRKVTTLGIISTVAGSGGGVSYPNLGDGGSATNAELDSPYGLAVDDFGNIFIADTLDNRIRKVTPQGSTYTVVNASVTNAGNYQVIISGPFGSTTSSVAVLTVDLPPAMTRQPLNVFVLNGGVGMLSASASGTLPLSYQWQFNGTNLPATGIFKGLGAQLSFQPATTNDAGPYDVVVTNAFGSVTSSVATVTIVFPPAIVSQPTNEIVVNGGNAIFSVTASGTAPLGYQWQFDGTNLTDGAGVFGSATPTLSLSQVTAANAGGYSVVVESGWGIVTSSVATLTITYPPAITNQPVSQTIPNGQNITFKVGVTGTPPFTYQWLFNGMDVPPGTFASSIITTFAGDGQQGFSGDGGPATNAMMSIPDGMAMDEAGNLFIADDFNARIRKVDTNGIITTFAGTGTLGYSGDGGPATNASIAPVSLAVDGFGNVYMSDQGNNVVRKIDTNGIITTVAGNGTGGYSGDGGPATNAALNFCSGLAVDIHGNLFIANQGNSVVRRVDANGMITTVAGNNTAGFSGDGGAATNASLNHPIGLLTDQAGNLYIVDTQNNVVRKVDASGIITTCIGNGSAGYSGDGGAATNASLRGPVGIAADAQGNLYIADDGNQVVRQINPQGFINTVAGNGGTGYSGDGGPATNAIMDYPNYLAFDPAGNMYIEDTYNDVIRRVAAPGDSGGESPALALNNVTVAQAGSYQVVVDGAGGSVTSSVAVLTVAYPPGVSLPPASQSVLQGSHALLAVTATGTGPLFYQWQFDGTNLTDGGNVLGSATTNLVLAQVTGANAGLYDVVITNAWGSVTSSVATLTITYPPAVTNPPASQSIVYGQNVSFSVGAGGTGPFTYQWLFNGVALPVDGIITTVAGDGTQGYSGNGGPATNAMLSIPYGIALDQSGNLFIADSQNNVIRQVDTNGIITTIAGTGVLGYTGDGGEAVNAEVSPVFVAVDGNGNVFMADQADNVIRKIAQGIITTVAGTGAAGYSGDGGPATNATLNFSSGVSIDSHGNLFIADQGNNVIRKVDANGIITTVAGKGAAGYSGDGGAATNAALRNPFGVFADTQGNLFIVDDRNNAIRKVDTNGIITTFAGTGSAGYSGDGGPATNATLNTPFGVVADAFGNVFIADPGNEVVRRVDPNGIITTVVGNGQTGYTGDGGPATNAVMDAPACVTLDAGGNLYIADTYNDVIRKVVLNGAATATAPTLTLNDVAPGNNGNYQVIVTSAWGSVTSSVAVLTLVYPPAITNQPVSQTMISGSNATFTVTAGGTAPLNYQWQFDGTNLTDGADISGSASPALTVSQVAAGNAGNYDVIITNAWGSVTSSVAALTVVYPPAITSQPVSQNIVNGHSANLTVSASGTAPLGYQWQFDGTNLTDGSSLSGSTTTNLVLSQMTVSNAGNYQVVITNAWGSVTSSVASLVIVYPPAITSQPVSQGILLGQNFTLEVSVTGTGPLQYQWQANGTNIIGQRYSTTTTLFFDPVLTNSGGLYDIVITNAWGSVTSSIINLTVLFPPVITNQPLSLVLTNASTATFTVGAAGPGPLTYQWIFNQKGLPSSMITTVAGSGSTLTGGYSGDGGAATNATLNAPYGVAVDANGNLFVADRSNQRVRKVNAGGIITTVAGNGNMGYNATVTAATNSPLAYPSAVAVDANNDVFFADQSNERIRTITYGLLLTVAGNGVAGYSGDGGDAVLAELALPAGVAVDGAGNIYIADTISSHIRKVDIHGTITTVAGKSVPGYSGDGGAATNANLNNPTGLTVDAAGDLFIADSFNNRIRKVDTNGIITTVAGGTSNGYNGDGLAATNAWLNQPSGVAVDNYGDLFIADTRDNRIRMVNAAGIISTVAGQSLIGFTGDGGSATNASLNTPRDVTVNSNGVLFIADTGNQRIREVTPQGPTLTLANLNATNAGTYQVIVSGANGSVTSSVVRLTLYLAPSLLAQPGSESVIAGDPASFGVQTAGTSPFAYQWQFDNTNLPGRVDAALSLSSTTPMNAGNYQVVVTNLYGSIVSSVATLTVSTPQVSVVPGANGSVTLNLVTARTLQSEIQTTTNLTPPVVWESIYTNSPGNSTWQFTDTNTASSPFRFYRTSTP